MAFTQIPSGGGGSSTLDTNTATSGLSGILKASGDTLDVAVAGTDYLAADAELAAIGELTSAADRLPYFTGSGTAALATFTGFARNLLDDASASDMRTTLELGTLATQAANSVSITGGSVTGLSALTASAGTLTASTPFDFAQTWNDAGVTFTGLRLNVTNTSSGSSSLLMALATGGTNRFSVGLSGDITIPYIDFFRPITCGGGSAGFRLLTRSGHNIVVENGQNDPIAIFRHSNSVAEFSLGSILTLNSGGTPYSQDLILRSASAATLQLGTNHATTATNQTIKAHNVTTGTGADLILQGGTGSVASGNVRFGTHSAIGSESVTGFITIKDEGGTVRKLAVVS